jgi:ABC-type polysaccharide/polyol phosphate export permease
MRIIRVFLTETLHRENLCNDFWQDYLINFLLLCAIWLWYWIEVRDRQTLLGIMWIVLLPLSTALVLSFALIATIVILTVVYGMPPNIYYLLLPVPALIMIIMSTGLALLIGWFSIVIRDLQQLLGVLMQLLFFATIFYAPGRVASPNIARIMALNPLAAIVVAFRDILLYGQSPDWVSLYLPGVLSVVFLWEIRPSRVNAWTISCNSNRIIKQ